MENIKKFFWVITLIFCLKDACLAEEEKWSYIKAKPQPFTETKDYVIAVGKIDDPIKIKAKQITDALKADKGIRFKYVKVIDNLSLKDYKVKKNVYFTGTIFPKDIDLEKLDFLGDADFYNADFLGDAYFWRANFSGDVNFYEASFSGDADFEEADFTGDADFEEADFSGDARFNGANFSGDADFEEADFSGDADFEEADFSGDANFYETNFSGDANFKRTDFSEYADFEEADFSGDADFEEAHFSGDADFEEADFSGDARFNGAKFSGDTDFEEVDFSGDARFNGAKFSEIGNVDFSESRFAKMLIEWFPNNQSNGIKGKLVHDRAFLLALEKNFSDLGFHKEKNDVDYTYRKWIRDEKIYDKSDYHKEKPSDFKKSWFARWGEKIFLDLPFGYGVKPWFLFKTYILICLVFGFLYSIFLRQKDTGKASIFMCNKKCFLGVAWSFYHSLDILTPGIDFQSEKIIPANCVLDEKRKQVYWGQVIQRLFGWYLLVLFLIMFSRVWVL